MMLNGRIELYIAKNCDCKKSAFTFSNEKELILAGFMHIEAQIPGNFELDMQRNGLLDDIFFGTNPLNLQELENRHLWYVKHFPYNGEMVNPHLIFYGIDTFADIYLNGEKIARSDNMFLPCEVSVEGRLKAENELMVHIFPTFIESRKLNFGFDVNSYLHYNAESLMLRKAAHSYGWDIMPRIVSGGIWKSVELFDAPEEAFNEFYLYTLDIADNKAYLKGYYNLELAGDYASEYEIKLTAQCNDSEFTWYSGRLWHNQGIIGFEVQNPLLWWPKDAGPQNLYSCKAMLYRNGLQVATKKFNLGIRLIELEMTDYTDSKGNGQFLFRVNRTPIYVRGTNWVPLDAFHSRDKERLPKALELLGDSKCNMVRCWGGNVYPEDAFYDYCDRNGIMVWQDFAMGCASYPQNDDFCAKINCEVTFVVKQYRQHCSLAVWAGDNECDVATYLWAEDKINPSENRITRVIIPNVLRVYDPKRIYLPSSPYISRGFCDYESEKYLVEDHLWGPRDYFKNPFYFTAKAHFASEIGYHGCPSPDSVRKFIDAECLWPNTNEQWLVHAASMETDSNAPYAYRIKLMTDQIEAMFGRPARSFDEFALLSQICQAEAMKFFIEHFRYQKWRRTGLIWWNLLDGWPQFSDAVIDYYYVKKLAFSYICRSQEPLCLMFMEPDENGRIILTAVNDYLSAKSGSYKVTDLSSGSTVLHGTFRVDGNITCDLGELAKSQDMTIYLIEWNCDGKLYRNHYLSGKAFYSPERYIELAEKAGILNLEGF